MTFRARADFDNVYAGTTEGFTLAWHDFDNYINDPEPDFTELGGNWTWVERDNGAVAMGQLDNTVDARLFVGTPTGDQAVETRQRSILMNRARGPGWPAGALGGRAHLLLHGPAQRGPPRYPQEGQRRHHRAQVGAFHGDPG